MDNVPVELESDLRRTGQNHVLRWWPDLTSAERSALVEQLHGLDLNALKGLAEQSGQKFELPAQDRVGSLPWPASKKTAEWRPLAEKALRAGQVAFLVVAGGQGSRLGFEHPKGMFPIGPVSNKTLFQIHFEKVAALRDRFGSSLPFLVMTSHATHEETVAYFKSVQYFGFAPEEVIFFQQGTMPALDLASGRLLLEKKHQLFLSPNGHGGTLSGLADHGLIQHLRQRGITTLYYFQVDNPLITLADFDFIGQHLSERAEISCKVIPKETPFDKVGNFSLIDGRLSIVEYSDLPRDWAERRAADGRLWLWAGNPAIHLFDLDFLKRITADSSKMPFHVAKKKVPFLDESGRLTEPTNENALKFERFIFDALPWAERWAMYLCEQVKEFAPLKNASGPDSPATTKQAISDLAGSWLEAAGVKVPRNGQGNVAHPIEISPLFAIDADELKSKVDPKMAIDGPTYLAG